MKLSLEIFLEIDAHHANAVAGSPSDSRMRIVEKAKDHVHNSLFIHSISNIHQYFLFSFSFFFFSSSSFFFLVIVYLQLSEHKLLAALSDERNSHNAYIII